MHPDSLKVRVAIFDLNYFIMSSSLLTCAWYLLTAVPELRTKNPFGLLCFISLILMKLIHSLGTKTNFIISIACIQACAFLINPNVRDFDRLSFVLLLAEVQRSLVNHLAGKLGGKKVYLVTGNKCGGFASHHELYVQVKDGGKYKRYHVAYRDRETDIIELKDDYKLVTEPPKHGDLLGYTLMSNDDIGYKAEEIAKGTTGDNYNQVCSSCQNFAARLATSIIYVQVIRLFVCPDLQQFIIMIATCLIASSILANIGWPYFVGAAILVYLTFTNRINFPHLSPAKILP